MAQEISPMPRPTAFTVTPELGEEGLLTAVELDALLGSIALFPDPLLTQIFVASTVPLDVMKADRWVAANTALPVGERTSVAKGQGWDESVAVLAAGFPSVLQRMAAEIDATETLGNAVLAQTDDVLDSVQRLRAQASATGYLETNEAQTVSVDDTGEIAIAPTDPDVVYVPAYDPGTAFTTAPTAPTYVTADPIYTTRGYTTGTLLTTGAIAFGSAMLVDEIFDDDDDWDDYWGPGSIDWDEDDFYHRPDVDIEGDVNIDRVVIDRDRTDIGDRPGAIDPDRVREGAWQPNPERRADAQAQLERRREAGGAEGEAQRLGDGRGGELAAAAAGAAAGGGLARANLEKSLARRDASAPLRPAFDSALTPKRQGAPQVRRAQDRGASSLGASRGQVSRPKSVSRPSAPRPAAQRSAPKQSSFQRSSGGVKPRAASSRGRSSAGRSGGGRRR
jgi:Protein of unknown function (DUF3300)